jgi:hypothetical protein
MVKIKKDIKIITGIGGLGATPKELKKIINATPIQKPSDKDVIIISVDSNPSKK